MEIFKLFGSIFVDSTKADESLGKTDKKAKGLSETFGKAVKTAGKMGAGVVAAATAAGKGMKKLVDSAAGYADEIDKAALRTGISTDSLQKLKYAAEQSGASLGNIENTAKKLNNALGEITQGSKTGDKAIAAFKTLGVEIRNANGELKSADEIYNESLLRLADMGDTAEATAAATAIFGKGFTDLKPLLAAGSEGITELTTRADELGLVMDKTSITAGVVFGDTMADVKNVIGAAGNEIGASLIPITQKLADKLIEWLPKITGFIGTLGGRFAETGGTIIDAVIKLGENLLPPLLDIIEQLLPIAMDIIDLVLPVLAEALPVVGEIIQNIVIPALEALMDFLEGDFETGIQKASEAYIGIWKSCFSIIDGIFGTNLSGWYGEVTAFWRDAGAKLYEIANAEKIAEAKESAQVGELQNEVEAKAIELMKQGVETDEALERAKKAVLDTTEKAALFNAHLTDVVAANVAMYAENLAASGQIRTPGSTTTTATKPLPLNEEEIPHYASGGIAYGKTLAVIGDNADAAVNPEVVAPISELSNLIVKTSVQRSTVDVETVSTVAAETIGKATEKAIKNTFGKTSEALATRSGALSAFESIQKATETVGKTALATRSGALSAFKSIQKATETVGKTALATRSGALSAFESIQKAAVNPEVVAPISELRGLAGNDKQTALLEEILEILVAIRILLGTRQKVEIPVYLGNGAKLASAMVDDINALIRTSGKNVFIQV